MSLLNNKAEVAVALSWGALGVFLVGASHGRKEHTASPASGPSPSSPREPSENKRSQIVPLHDLEKQAIISALYATSGDKLLAATKLGIGKTTLYRKLKKYGIPMDTDRIASHEAHQT